jgi:hypothetical protein
MPLFCLQVHGLSDWYQGSRVCSFFLAAMQTRHREACDVSHKRFPGVFQKLDEARTKNLMKQETSTLHYMKHGTLHDSIPRVNAGVHDCILGNKEEACCYVSIK